MPYIESKSDRRIQLRDGAIAQTAGELNYQCFYYVKHNYNIDNLEELEVEIRRYVDKFLGSNPNYQRYNDMTGALIRCAKEIRRRLKISIGTLFVKIMENYDKEINEYEDIKIHDNDDVE